VDGPLRPFQPTGSRRPRRDRHDRDPQPQRTQLIDSYAAQIDLADLCEEFPLAVVTGFTSATMRGWTSANMGSFRQLRQPNRSPRPEKWDGLILDWYPTDPLELTSDVECRLDENGRPYRIASIERTLVDLVVAESGLTVDDIEESFAGAFASGGQTPDIGLVRTLAMKAGMLESLRSYLAPYI
jgi:hypothetical protein